MGPDTDPEKDPEMDMEKDPDPCPGPFLYADVPDPDLDTVPDSVIAPDTETSSFLF
jgi:hypothetical protein